MVALASRQRRSDPGETTRDIFQVGRKTQRESPDGRDEDFRTRTQRGN